MARRLISTALLAVVLTACSSSSPTAPVGAVTPVAATYEGVWTITYTVAECGGFRQCVHYRGDSRTIYLHVTPVAGGYEGVVQLEPQLQVSVSGSLGADGRLTLKGIRRAALADDYETEVEALTLPALGVSESPQAGALRFATRGMAGGIPVTATVAGSTVRLSGSAAKPASGVNVAYAVESDGLVVDRVGRLTGSLRFVATYDWRDGRGTWTVSYPAIPLHSVARSLR